jgi:hypothetical protein
LCVVLGSRKCPGCGIELNAFEYPLQRREIGRCVVCRKAVCVTDEGRLVEVEDAGLHVASVVAFGSPWALGR